MSQNGSSPQPEGADGDTRITLLPPSRNPHSGASELTKPLLDDEEHQAVPAKPSEGPEPTITGQLKRLVFLSLPLAAQFLATLSLPVISNMSVGHLNEPLLLSSALLGSSIFMVFGWSVLMALSTAQDTIVGQAFGARNYSLVGITLQRGILVAWTLCVPMVIWWWNIGPVLTALGIAPQMVGITAKYLRMLSPTIFSVAVVANLQRWLVSQRIVHIASASVVVASALAPVYNWLFIHRLAWGMVGAATAFYCAFTTYALIMVILAVIHFRKMTGPEARVWSGFSRQAFSHWGHYLSYGIPAMIMICCEMWIVEAMLFMNGFLPNAEVSVAVMGLLQNMTGMCSVAMSSIGIGASTLIANALGAGNATLARTTFRAGASVALIVQEVVDLACHTLPFTMASLLASGITSVFSGALRGTGRQKWGALLNLTAYWLIGLPISFTLGLKLQWGPPGFWTGLAAANWVQVTIQAILLFRLNWDTEVARAQALSAAGPGGAATGSSSAAAQHAQHARRASIEEALVLASQGATGAIVDAGVASDLDHEYYKKGPFSDSESESSNEAVESVSGELC